MMSIYIKIMALLLAFSPSSYSDQIFVEDLIVKSSLCVGSECINGELFDFDTVLFKSNDPQVRFQDTSSTASFPTSDWVFGFTDENSSVTPYFFLRDEDQASNVLVLESGATGGVALGAASTLEASAVSVGNITSGRRIVFVADGIDATDAATMGQFTSFTTTAAAGMTTEINSVDNSISQMQTDLAELQSRVNGLIARLDALSPITAP